MPERVVSPKERELAEKAQKFLPGGSSGNTWGGLVMREGKGGRIRDVSGNEYVDFLLGSGPMLVGHANQEVVEAVRQQLDRGTTFFADNEHAILLAEEISKAVPCAEKVRFGSSGTEATFYALRTARAFRRRDKILKFEGGFHGMHDYALMSMAPSDPPDFPQAKPDTAGIPRSIQDEVLIAPFNDIETTTAIIEKYHDELAAVIVEPFQRLLPPKEGFLQGLREVTLQYEIPLIFDEIVTGFRFAYGGAQEYYGVVPDMCTLGKVVAGGFPLSAVTGKDEIMSHLDRNAVDPEGFVAQVGTLNGNPIAAVAGLATLNILKREGTYERLFATGNKLKTELQRMLDEAEIPAKVVGEPPLFDVFFTEDEITDYRSTLSADKDKLSRFNKVLLENGVLKGNSKMYISAAHDSDDVEKALDAFQAAVDDLRNG